MTKAFDPFAADSSHHQSDDNSISVESLEPEELYEEILHQSMPLGLGPNLNASEDVFGMSLGDVDIWDDKSPQLSKSGSRKKLPANGHDDFFGDEEDEETTLEGSPPGGEHEDLFASFSSFGHAPILPDETVAYDRPEHREPQKKSKKGSSRPRRHKSSDMSSLTKKSTSRSSTGRKSTSRKSSASNSKLSRHMDRHLITPELSSTLTVASEPAPLRRSKSRSSGSSSNSGARRARSRSKPRPDTRESRSRSRPRSDHHRETRSRSRPRPDHQEPSQDRMGELMNLLQRENQERTDNHRNSSGGSVKGDERVTSRRRRSNKRQEEHDVGKGHSSSSPTKLSRVKPKLKVKDISDFASSPSPQKTRSTYLRPNQSPDYQKEKDERRTSVKDALSSFMHESSGGDDPFFSEEFMSSRSSTQSRRKEVHSVSSTPSPVSHRRDTSARKSTRTANKAKVPSSKVGLDSFMRQTRSTRSQRSFDGPQSVVSAPATTERLSKRCQKLNVPF